MATTTPKGTLVWSNAPTATQSVQPSQTPVTPSGSLQWTSSPTYSVDDIFSTPEDTRSTADILRETFGYTQNIDRQKEIASRYIAGKSSTPEMLATTGMNTVGAFLSPVVKGVGKVLQGVDYVISGKGEYNPIPTKNLYTDLKQGTVETYNSAVDTISDSTTVQKYANTESSKSFEEYLRGVNDLLAITPLPKVVVATNKAMSAAEEYALQQLNKARQSNADSSLQKVIAQIEQVEKVGAKSKIPYSAKDALVTQKMAQSNVLPQTVDKTGTVDATAIKEAQRQYLEQPIGQQEDGSPITVRNAESVVGRLLKQEGATVNINEVIGSLVSAVERTGLAADIMERAMRVGIPNYTMALMKYADEFGNIKLEDIHTEKIRTTSNLDYSKPASTVYRKALGTGLRKIIENKSKHPISEINQELGIHLEAVKRIGKLAGKKVEGGRFGIHVARGVGTGLGIVLGSVAGPVGGAVAGAIGGGIGTAVQTAKMQRTFGKQGKSTMPGSDLIEKASIEASKPPVRDLSKPDVPVGARKSIPKTKEILRLERSIKENVQAQKEAIKAKDFVLVEKLKDIYDHLVAELKSAIQRIKDTPNKQGGFANWNPSKSRTPSEHQKSGGKSSADTTTHLAKAQEALREAKKYKTAEEFVKSTPKTVKVWNKSKFSNDGAYADIPVVRKEEGITLYQGGSAEGRQFWTPDKKYAEQFGEVKEKTGTFYKIDNGNRVTDVYIEAPTRSQLTDIWKQANAVQESPLDAKFRRQDEAVWKERGMETLPNGMLRKIGEKVDDLTIEAKGKTLDEFVYRGVKDDAVDGLNGRGGDWGNGTYYTTDPKMARVYGKNIQKATSLKDPFVFSYKNYDDLQNSVKQLNNKIRELGLTLGDRDLLGDKLTAVAKKLGKDGIKIDGQGIEVHFTKQNLVVPSVEKKLRDIGMVSEGDNMTTKEIASKLKISTQSAYKMMSDLEKQGNAYKVGYRTRDGWEDPSYSGLHTNSLSWSLTDIWKQANPEASFSPEVKRILNMRK